MSVFARSVMRRFPLQAREQRFLEQLESRPIAVKRGDIIAQEGNTADCAFVLMTGWAMSYTRFPDGCHQVRRLHFPGDLLAMPSVSMRHHAEDVEALSDGVIAPFPKKLLTKLFSMPRLAAIMYMFAQAERITAGDRLGSLGRNSAKRRIAFLLMDILHRLRSVDSSVTRSFTMHLTREQVAHVTGMTPVHASRMWCALVADRLIRCDKRTVTILDEERLAELALYSDRNRDFDFGWLNEVEQVPTLLS